MAKMKKGIKVLIVVGIIVVVLIAGVVGLSAIGQKTMEAYSAQTLTTTALERKDLTNTISLTGNIQSASTRKVYLEASGAGKAQTLNVSAEEIRRFREISEKMYLPYDKELDIFVQHDTFLDKDLMPASELPAEDRPLNQKWSWDHILRSCFIKQADVLQGLYFLEHLYDKETIRRNFDFYEPMTVHESSLSPCVHSILAASLGKLDRAQEFYRRTARLDLDNINNDTCDGLHITSMAGSWLSIVQGFAGMRTLTGQLSFDPQLPDGWDGYAFKIVYRGRLIEVSVSRDGTGLKLLSGDTMTVLLHGREVTLVGSSLNPEDEND